MPARKTAKTPRSKKSSTNTSEPTKKEDFGALVKNFFPTPTIDKFEIIELNASGFIAKPQVHEPTERFTGLANVLQAAIDNLRDPSGKSLEYKRDKSKAREWMDRQTMLGALDIANDPESRPFPPNYMPLQIQTRMNLSRYFYETEGDAYNIVSIPIELLSRKVAVRGVDKGMKRDIDEFIAVKRLEEIGGEIWRSMRKYGAGYPYEVWADETNKDFVDAVPLNPLNVHVGYYWYAMTAEAYGKGEWNTDLIQSVFPPAMYKSLMRHWNDNPFDPQTMSGKAPGMLISGKVMKPVVDGVLRWEKYPMPMLSRGFRELTTRIIYEDAIRAIVEGMRNQFWVIKLGSPDRFNPNEMNALKSALGNSAGERTGLLVWRDSPLAVEVYVPAGLDQMIGNDYHGALTKDFFRKMGVNSRVMSGEQPGTLGSVGGRGGGGGGNTADIDVTLYLERARYQAAQITDWMAYIVRKWMVAQGSKYAQKNISKMELVYGPTSMEMADRIKNIFAPMYDSGALSHQTFLQEASLDSDAELDNKRQEKRARDDGLLDPPLTYKQGVVGGDGEMKTTTQTQPLGSPDAAGEHKNKLDKLGKSAATPIEDNAPTKE